MSLFISFEGGDGSGKSTQIELLANRLQASDMPYLVVQEPGSTGLGLYVRKWLKRETPVDQAISRETELFLFAAARVELVTNIIKPALARHDTIVIADRYADSTHAYQGSGRGIPESSIKTVNDIATQEIYPDITFLMDCPPEISIERIGTVQLESSLEGAKDSVDAQRHMEGTRFEQESLNFHKRVRDGYLGLVKKDPNRWTVIDATKPAVEISRIIWERICSSLSFEI